MRLTSNAEASSRRSERLQVIISTELNRKKKDLIFRSCNLHMKNQISRFIRHCIRIRKYFHGDSCKVEYMRTAVMDYDENVSEVFENFIHQNKTKISHSSYSSKMSSASTLKARGTNHQWLKIDTHSPCCHNIMFLHVVIQWNCFFNSYFCLSSILFVYTWADCIYKHVSSVV